MVEISKEKFYKYCNLFNDNKFTTLELNIINRFNYRNIFIKSKNKTLDGDLTWVKIEISSPDKKIHLLIFLFLFESYHSQFPLLERF